MTSQLKVVKFSIVRGTVARASDKRLLYADGETKKKGIKGETCKQNKVNKKIGKVAGRSVGRYPVDCRRHGNISEYQLVLPDQRNVLRLKNQQKRLCCRQ